MLTDVLLQMQKSSWTLEMTSGVAGMIRQLARISVGMKTNKVRFGATTAVRTVLGFDEMLRASQ